MKLAAEGRVDLALVLVVSAAALDGVDGRIARMIHATSKIGAELDSLADAINFGVVPALILASVLLKGHDLGWAIVPGLLLRDHPCGWRGSSTLSDDENAPATTAASSSACPRRQPRADRTGPRRFARGSGRRFRSSLPVVGGWTLLAAFPCDQPHSDVVTQGHDKALALCTGPGPLILVAGPPLLVTYPYTLMTLLIAAYLAHIPFAWWANRWVEARPSTGTHCRRAAVLPAHDEQAPAEPAQVSSAPGTAPPTHWK